MKPVSQMAEALDISSGIIRKYLMRFEDFFSDPTEHEGVRVYPNGTSAITTKLYGYHQNNEMTKNKIRAKLSGAKALLIKPIIESGLARTVRKVLDEAE